MITIADQMEIVQKWWDTIDPQKKLEQSSSKVAELFVKKKIASD